MRDEGGREEEREAMRDEGGREDNRNLIYLSLSMSRLTTTLL